ncbi:hypothetical protein E0Z10_g1096 [Xylaria hypoxylon]|uniref:Xylanolytic transcriptional activator regulatory domain-containing protein n=1 Tax=Xylaria hypoxylon TaxID=37992 RepID=A0A4Z0YUC4_9PEZI|nr:hypothetical protein E0Z10_g1096 [Xylaria hypoxylon]
MPIPAQLGAVAEKPPNGRDPATRIIPRQPVINAGLESWSSTFRRVNHTKQLRDDFSTVMDRLDEVHQTLNQLASLTRDIVARPYCHGHAYVSGACGPRCATTSSSYNSTNMDTTTAVTTASTSPSTTPALATLRHDLQNSGHFVVPSANGTIFDFPDNEGCSSEDSHFLPSSLARDHSGERATDSPASVSLIQGVASQISGMMSLHDGKDAPYGFRDAGVQVALQHLRNSFPFEIPCPDPGIIDDNRPVTTPPRLMVDLFMESFLCSFNTSFPIFEEAELRRAVDTHYAAEQPVDNSPWALIFTNVVVLGLGLEAQVASVSKSHPKSMHHELMSSFLRNCDRAIANLDSFTRPSVVNIQALLTLALVGREFYKNAVFEKACQTACHLARIVGLHRSRTSEGDAQVLEKGDRDRLFRVLYAMDKYRTFLTGHPCDLYLFDCEGELDVIAEESPSTKLNHAFDHIMRIWEEIYLTLYSKRASVAGAKARAQRVSSMTDLALSWAQRYGGLMEPTDSGFESKLVSRRLELKYCYHITQVLILRCDGRSHIQRQMLDHSRACIRVIASIANMPVTTVGLASLARILQNYPIASFTELLRFHLHNLGRGGPPDEASNDDIELFRCINRSIKPMQHPDLPQTYLSRLVVGISWLLQVFETVTGTTHKSLNTPDNQVQSMPISYVNPPSSRPPSYSASTMAMSNGVDGIGHLRPGRGFSQASSISSCSEREHRRAFGEAELTSFGVSTPLTDPMSKTVGQGSSSNSSLYLDGPQFDSTVMSDQSWDMDLWKEIFPS